MTSQMITIELEIIVLILLSCCGRRSAGLSSAISTLSCYDEYDLAMRKMHKRLRSRGILFLPSWPSIHRFLVLHFRDQIPKFGLDVCVP
jgi:hypothetical protein